MALPYGGEWRGNFTLLHMYEQLAYDNFEDRFNLRGPVAASVVGQQEPEVVGRALDGKQSAIM